MDPVAESTGNLKSHNVNDIPEDMWDDWKDRIPRRYSPLGEAIIELVAADLLCRRETGAGAVDVLINEGIIERDEVDALLVESESESDDGGEA